MGLLKGGQSGGGPAPDDKALEASARLWASVVLLGPVLPSLLAVLIVGVGHAILLSDKIDRSNPPYCGYPVDKFLQGAIAVSYLFLLAFCWCFIGFEWSVVIRNKKHCLLRPFPGLLSVGVTYMGLFLLSIVVWIFGTWAVLQGRVSCPSTNPTLYPFTVFIAAAYWLGVGFASVYVVQIKFGSIIARRARNATGDIKQALQVQNAENANRMEEDIVVKKFKDHDHDRSGQIDRSEFEELLGSLGIHLRGKSLQEAYLQLDTSGDGKIGLREFLEWYQHLKAQGDGEEGEDSEG